MEQLRKNVRFLRKQRGYTLEQFGRLLGISKHTVSAFESGWNGISIPIIKKIRDLFNVSLDELFYKDFSKMNKN